MRRHVLMVLVIGLITTLVSSDLVAQGRGGGRGGGGRGAGGGGRGAGGGSPSRGGGQRPPGTPGSDDPAGGTTGGGATSNPERNERSAFKWEICPAKEALVDGPAPAEEADILAKIVATKGRAGYPVVVMLNESSFSTDELEKGLFKDERVALGALFATYIRLTALAPFPVEMAKKITGGKGVAILVFDHEKKEVKRFQGPGVTAPALVQALASPVKKAHNMNLQQFIDQEQKLLNEIDKLWMAHQKNRADADALAGSNNAASTQKKILDLDKEAKELADQIEELKKKELTHVNTAPARH